MGYEDSAVYSSARPNFSNLAVYTVCAGSLIVSGDFKPVSALKNQRSEQAFAQSTVTAQISSIVSCCRGLDANTLRVDFMSLNHRGQVMPMAAPAVK